MAFYAPSVVSCCGTAVGSEVPGPRVMPHTEEEIVEGSESAP